MGSRAGRCCVWRYPRFFGVIEGDLIAFAEHNFSLSKTDKNGVSRRDHLEQVAKATGKDVGLLGPALPDVAMHLWHLFLDLHRGRDYGANGPNPLSYQLILAWSELTGIRLSPWEVDVVKVLDSLWINTVNED